MGENGCREDQPTAERSVDQHDQNHDRQREACCSAFGNRSELRRVSSGGNVAGHDATSFGVVEGATDDEMDLQHRLWRQGLASVGRVQLLVIQCFEMMRT